MWWQELTNDEISTCRTLAKEDVQGIIEHAAKAHRSSSSDATPGNIVNALMDDWGGFVQTTVERLIRRKLVAIDTPDWVIEKGPLFKAYVSIYLKELHLEARKLCRTKLNVPYAEKDDAKALGASWDPVGRIWYLEAGSSKEAFEKWLPKKVNPKEERKG